MEGQPVLPSDDTTENLDNPVEQYDELRELEQPEPVFETPESTFSLGRLSLAQTLELADDAATPEDVPDEEDEEPEEREEPEKDLPTNFGSMPKGNVEPARTASGLDITDEETRMAALEFIFPVTLVPADELLG